MTAMLSCESLTMISVLGLWAYAAVHDHPMARPVLAAVSASAAAAVAKVVPAEVTARVGLDPTSAYHLAQIDALQEGGVELARGGLGDGGEVGLHGGKQGRVRPGCNSAAALSPRAKRGILPNGPRTCGQDPSLRSG